MAVRREQIMTTAIAFVEEARVPVDHACDTSSRFHHQHLGIDRYSRRTESEPERRSR